MNPFMQNLPQNPCFQSLPVWVQETILQSGAEFSSEQELREFAAGLARGGSAR